MGGKRSGRYVVDASMIKPRIWLFLEKSGNIVPLVAISVKVVNKPQKESNRVSVRYNSKSAFYSIPSSEEKPLAI